MMNIGGINHNDFICDVCGNNDIRDLKGCFMIISP